MSVFERFKELKYDMEMNGWVIEAFPFNYNRNNYTVLVKLYQQGDTKPPYALLEVEILKSNDINDSLIVPANVNGFIIDAKTLREFFGIAYSENIGNILNQFNEYFSDFIPTQINLNKPQELINVMTYSLSISDSEDPNKLYCFAMRRNPNNGQRSPFNDNKSRLLRPSLYLRFENENTVSFSYSAQEEREKSDEEIIMNFSRNA